MCVLLETKKSYWKMWIADFKTADSILNQNSNLKQLWTVLAFKTRLYHKKCLCQVPLQDPH